MLWDDGDFVWNYRCAEQMMITYLYTDTFDVSKSSFLKLMPSLLCIHPLLAILDIYLMVLWLLKLVHHAIYPQLCLQFVMNINYLNLFQAPTPGIVLRWGFTRGWLISSAHQMWSSRSPPSPSSLVWRSRWQSATCNVVAQHLIISKWLEMQLNRMFWEFLAWENSVAEEFPPNW